MSRMSRGCKNTEEVEPYTDGLGNTADSGTGCSDHECRPVLDAEGKEHPIISYSSTHDTEGHEMMEPLAVPFLRNAIHYTYITLVDPKTYAQRGSANNRPENEASNPRTTGSAPFSSNWRARPNSTGKDIGSAVDVPAAIKPMYGTNPQNKTNNYRVPEDPSNYKEGNQNANGNGSGTYFGNHPLRQRQQRFPAPRQTKDVYRPFETIDSKEAVNVEYLYLIVSNVVCIPHWKLI